MVMRRMFGKARVHFSLLGCAALVAACGSRSGSETSGLGRDAGRGVDAAAGRASRQEGGRSDSSVALPPVADARRPRENDAHIGPERDAARRPPRDGAPDARAREPDAHTDAAESGVRDATLTPSDGPRDAPTADALSAPDCSCPPLGFFLDATTGSTSMHLTAPYPLGIYCQETAVQLGHPPCGEVYRLSACRADGFAPPCLYMAVDVSHGLLLGNFVDASGTVFDVVDGTITPESLTGRVGTGTFVATIVPRAGGKGGTISGTFRACLPRFPAC